MRARKKRKIGRNDPCPCGSGKKFKKCCLNKKEKFHKFGEAQQTDRLPERTIRERNIILCNAISDILGFTKGKDWNDVRRDISDDQVREIHKAIAWLWPPSTKMMNLLPTPSTKLRALYVGITDPRVILQNVVRYSLYTDEIIVISPFMNPWCISKDFNPIDSPSQHKVQTLKNTALLMQLIPWIDAGIVEMIPDPGDFDYHLRVETWNMALKRQKEWKPSDEDLKLFEPLAKNDFENMILSLPPEHLTRMIKKVEPEISDSELKGVLRYVQQKRLKDPLAPLQTWEAGEEEGQLRVFSTGANLELGLFIAQATGSYLYTDIKHRWKEILLTVQSSSDASVSDVWSPLTKAFQELEFKFLNEVDTNFACNIRKDGKLEQFRNILRRIWKEVGGSSDPSKIDSVARDFADELKDEYRKAQAEWVKIDHDLVKWMGASAFGSSILPTIIGGMNYEIPLAGFGLHAIFQLLQARLKRGRFSKTVPMSVLLELKKYRKKIL